MGYRFSLEAANLVGNLTCGKVYTSYKSILESKDEADNYLAFLDHICAHGLFQDDYVFKQARDIFGEQYQHALKLNQMSDSGESFQWGDIHYNQQKSMGLEEAPEKRPRLYQDSPLLETMNLIQQQFRRCRVKALLLPDSKNREEYAFMCSSQVLKKLVEMHPGPSCLILQPDGPPENGRLNIYDAFPHIAVALQQMDQWPGVLFWDSKSATFAPIRSERELFDYFAIVRSQNGAVQYIQRMVSVSQRPAHYILHLSDLHLGSHAARLHKRRLSSLLRKRRATLNPDDIIDVVITGDITDSPDEYMGNEMRDFLDSMMNMTTRKPIHVPGNHDINLHGISLWPTIRRRVYNANFDTDLLQLLSDSRVLLLKFNSNTDGILARGKIGINQMQEMGNALDGIPDLHKYTLVAMLHHHICPIERPDYYDLHWYQRIFPENVFEGMLQLEDAELFQEWLSHRSVRLVLHGHKHIPFTYSNGEMGIVACGSSTGNIIHRERNKTCISYNMIKLGEEITCMQYVENVAGAGDYCMRTIVFP